MRKGIFMLTVMFKSNGSKFKIYLDRQWLIISWNSKDLLFLNFVPLIYRTIYKISRVQYIHQSCVPCKIFCFAFQTSCESDDKICFWILHGFSISNHKHYYQSKDHFCHRSHKTGGRWIEVVIFAPKILRGKT
jgi:hypothetical protein